MAIESVQWTDAARLMMRAVIDGRECFVPDDPANTDRQRIAREWEYEGKPILDSAPADRPPPVPRPSR